MSKIDKKGKTAAKRDQNHLLSTHDPKLGEIVAWYIREFLSGRKKSLVKGMISSLNQFVRIHGELPLSQVNQAVFKQYPRERRERAGKADDELTRSIKGEIKDIKTAIRRWELRSGCTTSEAIKETGFGRKILENWRHGGIFTPSLQVKGFGGRSTHAYSKGGPNSDIQALLRLRRLGCSDFRLIPEVGNFLRDYWGYPNITEALRSCELIYNGYDFLQKLPNGEHLSCHRRPGRKIPPPGTHPATWGDFIMDVYEQEFLSTWNVATQNSERSTIDKYILPLLQALPIGDVAAFQDVVVAARALAKEFPHASWQVDPRGNPAGVLSHISKAATSRGLLGSMRLANNRIRQTLSESPMTSRLRTLYLKLTATTGGASKTKAKVTSTTHPERAPVKRSRGRPAEVSYQRKKKAALARRAGATWRDVTKILRDTGEPTQRQVNNTPNIIKNFEKRYGEDLKGDNGQPA